MKPGGTAAPLPSSFARSGQLSTRDMLSRVSTLHHDRVVLLAWHIIIVGACRKGGRAGASREGKRAHKLQADSKRVAGRRAQSAGRRAQPE